jgi:uncharacterized Zn finger protein (UPF0148 family)
MKTNLMKSVKKLNKKEQLLIQGGRILMGTCCINGQQIDWPLTKKCAKTYCNPDDPNNLQ